MLIPLESVAATDQACAFVLNAHSFPSGLPTISPNFGFHNRLTKRQALSCPMIHTFKVWSTWPYYFNTSIHPFNKIKIVPARQTEDSKQGIFKGSWGCERSLSQCVNASIEQTQLSVSKVTQSISTRWRRESPVDSLDLFILLFCNKSMFFCIWGMWIPAIGLGLINSCVYYTYWGGLEF